MCDSNWSHGLGLSSALAQVFCRLTDKEPRVWISRGGVADLVVSSGSAVLCSTRKPLLIFARHFSPCPSMRIGVRGPVSHVTDHSACCRLRVVEISPTRVTLAYLRSNPRRAFWPTLQLSSSFAPYAQVSH